MLLWRCGHRARDADFAWLNKIEVFHYYYYYYLCKANPELPFATDSRNVTFNVLHSLITSLLIIAFKMCHVRLEESWNFGRAYEFWAVNDSQTITLQEKLQC